MPPSSATITPLPGGPFSPDLYARAWSSIPHPTRPLIATAHEKSVTVYSLSTLTKHLSLTGGHSRSVRSVAWQPCTTTSSSSSPSQKLRLVTGSFDSTAGLWSFDEKEKSTFSLEKNMNNKQLGEEEEGEEDEEEWEFNLVLEGHENEIKSIAFSPSGQFLATCSRDKTVWIWEEVDEDEWETVAVLSEHEGDVKCVAWAPSEYSGKGGRFYGTDCLASASYDDTVRIWREDGDGEWVCVFVIEGFGGTVWSLEWEKEKRVMMNDEKEGKGKTRMSRLVTACQDGGVKVWELVEEEEEVEEDGGKGDWSVPNRMRRELREEWRCVGEMPKVHTREVYSVAWSGETGVLASTGGDGRVVLYGEEEKEEEEEKKKKEWKVLTVLEGAHGPYEVNHVTWCKRWDKGTERKGEEEMLVTTGDDGVVMPWEVRFS
ncbi:WD40-repeat-containing domain protein [Cladorrhinum samala]|uniref:Probable cytosolic iron-sulfur protein assembly protein 1 n=1 Tax=Cladorrhinum samala TaxID=585594 RepID=A0AAV9HZZ6_9PEZI|nr:WD40-repeat-containing domain protein [Cladorrhinum samala]